MVLGKLLHRQEKESMSAVYDDGDDRDNTPNNSLKSEISK